MSVQGANYFRSFPMLWGPASSRFGINSPSRHRTPPNQRVLLRLLWQLLNTNREERKWKK